MGTSLAAHWTVLDSHFQHHARMVNRFREADGRAVLSMWRTQTNEDGLRLSRSEREALIERHCELFGNWPICAPCRGVKAHTLADLELADYRITEGKRLVADQRRRIADQKCADQWRLSQSMLLNFEVSLQLLITHRNMIAKELRAVGSH
jgi:hypothetical protein